MKIRLCIMSVFLSVLLFFTSFTVKANDVVFPAFPEPVEGKSSTHYLISFDSGTGTYYLLKPLDPQRVEVYRRSNGIEFRFATPAINYYWEAGEGGSSWIKGSELNHLTNLRIDNTTEFLYSSFDLFYSNGELFFQKAPIKANFLTQMREVEMGATMTTVVSLIPLSMALLVCLIGFRKTWAWLSKVLRKA